MLNKTSRIVYSIFFLAMIILSAWATNNNTMSRDSEAIVMVLANIGLMVNGEYARRAERDEKEDQRRNRVITVKSVLHG
jgi:hypothetical protein